MAHAASDEAPREFRIERASLEHVLLEIARLAGRHVSFSSDVVKDRLAGPVMGAMSTPDAARQALLGTDLMLAELPDGTLTVLPAGASQPPLATVLTLPPAEAHGALSHGFTVFSTTAVTGVEMPMMGTPQAIGTVSKAQLDSARPATLENALRDAGAVPVSADPAYATQFELRGFTTGTTYANGFPDRLSTLRPVEAVDSITVVKGPSADVAGLTPVGGAIGLDLKAPLATAQRSLAVEAGSYGERKAVADLGGPLGEHGLTYRLVGVQDTSANSQGGYAGHRVSYGHLALGWQDSATQVTAGAETLSSRQPVVPSTVALNGSPLRIPADAPLGNADDRVEARGTRLYYDASRMLSDDWTWRSRAQYQRLTTYAVQWASAPDTQTATQVAEMNIGYRIPDQGWAVSNELTGTLRQGPLTHTLTFGWDELQERRDILSPSDYPVAMQNLFAPQPLPAAVFMPSFNMSQSIRQSIFRVQDQLAIGERWEVLASLRANDYVAKLPMSHDQGVAWTPALSLLYKLTPQISLFGGYGRGFQLNPYYTFDGVPMAPERSGQWEAGARWSDAGKKLMAQAALFRIDARNVSVFDEEHPGAYIRVDSQTSQGAELSLQGALSPAIDTSVALAYTHLTAVVQGQPSAPPSSLHGTAWASYTLHGGVWDGAGAGLGLRGKTATTGYGADAPRIPGYLLTDANVFLNRKHWRLDLTLRNLFNTRAYGETRSSIFIPILPGRTASLRLTVNL